MKKIMAILLALVLVLTACGGNTNDDTGSDDPNGGETGSETGEDAGEETGEETTGEIRVVSREDGSGTRSAFVEIVGVVDEDDNDMTTQDAAIQGSTDEVLTYVSGDANAIGYISLGSLNDQVKALKMEGVEVSPENIIDGSYKIARPFNIAYKEAELSDIAKDFLEFVFSSEGQTIVPEEGYIAVEPDAAPYEEKEGLAGDLVIGGSTSVTPLMEVLTEEYMKLNPDVVISVQGTGSSAGMTGAMDGTLDIGMASRELKDEELAELDSREIAQDGIAIVVAPNNSFDDMTIDTLRDIYLGNITTWEEVK